MKLVLVRHGETEWNRLGKFLGQEDIPLNERGLAQAMETARAVAAMSPAAIYSSPLHRTMEVAAKISGLTELPVIPEEGLKELDLGQVEGVSGEEMRLKWAEVYARWRENPGETAMPQGESMAQLQERAWESISKLTSAYQPADVVVVISHNFTIRAIVTRFLGIPMSHFHRMTLALGSICIIDFDLQNPRLITYNSTGHLSPENH